jgi:hypothetical protein
MPITLHLLYSTTLKLISMGSPALPPMHAADVRRFVANLLFRPATMVLTGFPPEAQGTRSGRRIRHHPLVEV